jgi:GAF domain-containing protein
MSDVPSRSGGPGPVAGDPVVAAVVQAAVEATRASAGWLVAHEGDVLRLVAVSGDRGASTLGSTFAAGVGTTGYVIAAGQPLALGAGTEDPRLDEGIAAALGRSPRSVLCVPCSTSDAVLGALEVIDKESGGRFTFDDVELVTLLADVAATALSVGSPVVGVPEPAELASDLQRLAENDPVRYRAVASALDALLA